MSNSNVSEINQLGLSASESARLIGISRSHFWKLHASDRTPRPRRLGRRVVWSKPELIDWWDAGSPSYDQWQAIRKGGQR